MDIDFKMWSKLENGFIEYHALVKGGGIEYHSKVVFN